MKLSWKQTMPVWWSLVWRATIYGALLGTVLGFFAGMYAGLSGVPDREVLYGAIAGGLGTIPASMLALKQALGKNLVMLCSARG
jgi:hypothetical protein